MKFGAKADNKTDDAMAMIKAWNAACKSNIAAKLVIPSGDFVSGPILFRGPCTAQQSITIEIQGNLYAYDDISEFSNGAWIMLADINGVVVNGGGRINGRGDSVWEFIGGTKDSPPLPVSMVFEKVENGTVYNLNFVNSMGFHVKVTDSSNVALWNLTITAPVGSPNTDGVHLSSSVNINITDSAIGTGDDCISVGHGTENITISGITCGPGHGISIGSLGKRPDETNLKGVSITNCTLTGTTNGARIKTYHNSQEMEATNIVYRDIVMKQVKNPIIIDQHYDSKKKPQQSKVKISNVQFKNIKGTTISPVAISINCSFAVPCEGIELTNIDLVPYGSIGPLHSACSSAKIISTGNLNPASPTECV
ncbi:polygalacturonase [Dorcoceras hygrometricum]|uniref:Polygalacturonase n=1 Tax=Dorcoceras hygrometricum TaxID=472368 RepID=A0A2Z7D7J9_9LAMI|nr:polygalacturonase [Dorcoceras hygrometricum]